MTTTEHVRSGLDPLVHTEDDTTREAITALFTGDLFAPREGLTHGERCALTYQRARVVNSRLDTGTALIGDQRRLLAVLETAAMISPPLFLALTIHYCLGVTAIAEFGAGREDLKPYLDELDTMTSIGTLLVTELGHGNSHGAIRTEARYDRDSGEFVLHTPDPGARKFMSNNALPGIGKIGVVYARLLVDDTDHGIFGFVVRLRDRTTTLPGVGIRALPETPTLPLDYALISFDHVRVPRHSLLRDSATFTGQGTVQDPLGSTAQRLARSLAIRPNAWIASAVALAAVSRAGVTLAIRHAHHRITRAPHSADRPVIEFRTQQSALFGALATTYAMTCLVNRAKDAWIGSTGTTPAGVWAGPALTRTLGLTKATTSWAAEQVGAICGLRSGAHGMFSVNRFADYQGLAHMLNPAAGDSHLIALGAGRALAMCEDYQPPSAAPSPQVFADLLDPGAGLELALARERAIHDELTAQLDLDRPHSRQLFDIWDDRLPLALDLANAHAHRLTLEAFVDAVGETADPGARQTLTPLLALYSLDGIARDLGWYLSRQLITAGQAHAIPVARHQLLDRILPNALKLTEAFDIPVDLLHAPVSTPDYTERYTPSPSSTTSGQPALAGTGRPSRS
jgi:acyl-CoA oxidase